MKKFMLVPLLAGFFLLGTTSCATMEAQGKIDDAAAEIKKAKKMNYEWRDSMKILKKAQKALDAGDMEKAAKLTAKAKRQGELAQQQAKMMMNVNGPY